MKKEPLSQNEREEITLKKAWNWWRSIGENRRMDLGLRNYGKTLQEIYLKEINEREEIISPANSLDEKVVASHSSGFSNTIEQDDDDPYWIGQAYLQDKQLIEIEKMFDDNGLRLELTCAACPEQYDVYLKVGYLRLRHGEFRVDYPDCGGETIYESKPNGDGIFNKDERLKHMTDAMNAILKKFNSDKNVKASVATEADSSNGAKPTD